MQHMIYTRPELDKQLKNFICHPELKENLHRFIENHFDNSRLVLIHAESGNGASHIIQALCNGLRQDALKPCFLQFRKEDRFSDLNAILHADVLRASHVFIDGLENLLDDQEAMRFWENYAKEGGRLIGNVSNEASDDKINDLKQAFENSFKKIVIQPLSPEQRKMWAMQLLGHSISQNVPETLYDLPGTNRDFLLALEPYIQQQRMWHGQDYNFNRAFANKLRELQLELRKRQLELAEIELEKQDHIANQRYEILADLRDRQRNIQEEMNGIGREVLQLKETLPFLPGLLQFHFMVETLLNACFTEQKTMETLNKQVNELIEELRSSWLQLRQEKQLVGRQLFENMQDWNDAINRFNSINTKRNNQ